MSQSNIRRLITVGLGLGLGSVAAYLNTHGVQDTGFLWFGVFVCCLVALS
jgi:uncharacterized membrane protein YccC